VGFGQAGFMSEVVVSFYRLQSRFPKILSWQFVQVLDIKLKLGINFVVELHLLLKCELGACLSLHVCFEGLSYLDFGGNQGIF